MKKTNWKSLIFIFLVFIAALFLVRCQGKGMYTEYEEKEFLIGISQANMREPWRLVLTKELEEEASRHKNIRLITLDATSNTSKQMKDVKKLLNYGIDLLIISPCDTKTMTPIISEVYQKLPVIVMDKAVEGFDYTLFIGPDNQLIGKQSAKDIVKLLKNKSGTVLELAGKQSSVASKDKSIGFDGVISDYPNITKIQKRVGTEFRDEAEDLLLSMKEELKDVDVIFAHNDYMALGAYNAIAKLGYDIKIVGIDGFSGQNDGLNLVKEGKIYETIACSTGGKEAILYAVDILNKVSGIPKQVILRSKAVTQDNIDNYMQKSDRIPQKNKGIIDVGFSQIGAESAFRSANTKSIKDAAKDVGINLIYENADQDQKEQFKAIRKFIELKVDVIVISPVVDHGWDKILQEAKEAGIPVILSDRKINVDDDTLYRTYIGADFIEEGRRAMRWVKQNVSRSSGMVNILELQGTLNASPTLERNQGFVEVMEENNYYQIKHSVCGEFTYEDGRRVVNDYINNYDWDIDVIFAHNDDMALGAIEALEEKGIQPGVDVKIVSVDGTREAFEAMIEGKLNCVVECNPLLGPQLMKAIKDLMNGIELPLRIITEEKIYTQEEAADNIRGRLY